MSELSPSLSPNERMKGNGFFKRLREKLSNLFKIKKSTELAVKNQPKRDVSHEANRNLNFKERAVSNSNNWIEFYQAIDLIDSIPTSSGSEIKAREIKNRISKAYYSEEPLEKCDFLPRAFGIRQKYIQLLQASFQERDLYDSQEAFIDYGNPIHLKIKDPERYFSKSVSRAVDQALRELKDRKLTIENRKDLILIACNVVDQLLPYDHVGLNRGAVTADDDISMTRMIIRGNGGVCRQQAPFLTAVLKRLGFDAHQVWHEWQGEDSGHTLVYINDVGLKAFVNPGKPNDITTFMSFYDYEKISGSYTYKWRARNSNNSWQELDFESALAKNRY